MASVKQSERQPEEEYEDLLDEYRNARRMLVIATVTDPGVVHRDEAKRVIRAAVAIAESAVG